MNSIDCVPKPDQLCGIENDTRKLDFNMDSVPMTGSLLRTLAATKPGGKFLELGTGTGMGTCWILDGMDKNSSLITVDIDEEVIAVAQKHLASDSRLSFVIDDGSKWLKQYMGSHFDLIFADAWPGKFEELDSALGLLSKSGIYVIDDLLPQDSWPDGHAPKVPKLINQLNKRSDLTTTYMEWSTGILIATKI